MRVLPAPPVLLFVVFLRIDGVQARQRPARSPAAPCDPRVPFGSFLWTIDRDPPSYLFGTIHVPFTSVWHRVPRNVKHAFLRAKHVRFELELTDPDTMRRLGDCQRLPDGETLQQVLPPALLERLRRYLLLIRRRLPEWLDGASWRDGVEESTFRELVGDWERKRPVWLMLLLNTLTETSVRSRGTPVLDVWLAQQAKRFRKHSGAVELVRDQCDPLNRLGRQQVVFALNRTLSRLEFDPTAVTRQNERLVASYNCGDARGFHSTPPPPEVDDRTGGATQRQQRGQRLDSYFRRKLVVQRNRQMARRIRRELQNRPDKSFFFAVGAGHMLGDKSVISNLESAGIKIRHTLPTEELPLDRKWRRTHRKERERMEEFLSGTFSGKLQTSKLQYPRFHDLWIPLESSATTDSFFRRSAASQTSNSSSKVSVSLPFPFLFFLFFLFFPFFLFFRITCTAVPSHLPPSASSSGGGGALQRRAKS